MKRVKRNVLSWVLVLSASCLFLAYPSTGWAQAMEKVVLKYDFVFSPTVAPVSLGLEKGFFAAEGIDLDFQDSRGSVANIQLMAAEKLFFAFADLGTVAKFVGEGAPIKSVWGFMQRSPMSVIVHEHVGVRKPKDLEGKKLGATPADSGRALFPALAKANGVDLEKIQFVNVTPAARNTSLLNRDVDAIIAFFPDNVPFLRSKGAKVNYLAYADFGIGTLGKGINVHKSVLTGKPETLRRLLRGLARSVQYSRTNLDEAVAALKKRAPFSIHDPKVAREVLEGALSLLHTKHTQGKPLGWMAREDWVETIEILKNHAGLKNPLPPEEYYTNKFISRDIQ